MQTDVTGDLQEACEAGQRLLMETKYLQAESVLVSTEQAAWERRDFDTLARLYMPLQETRRQIRQRAGEGIVCLDYVARASTDNIQAERVLADVSHGQLLVAGWGSIAPALRLRELAREQGLYAETFLAASYPVNGSGLAVVIVPDVDVALPPVVDRSVDDLIRKAPPHSLVMSLAELPQGPRRGTTVTFAETMAMWEKLHLPFLTTADFTADPLRRIEAYRRTIRVDHACELAHQKLSAVAREVGRAARAGFGAASVNNS